MTELATTSLALAAPAVLDPVTSVAALPLFARTLHALVGPSEVGKSTLAGHAVLDVASAGRGVLLLDGEMSAPTWRHRLQQLGAPNATLGRVRYAEMSDAAADPDQVRAVIAAHDIALVIWDSALSLISRFSRSENDNAEVGRLFDRLRAIVRDGPAGLIVDHVGHGAATMVSRGASAKFAALDVSFGVRLADGAVPGPSGPWSSLLSVEKDRHGLLPGRVDREVTFAPLSGGRGIAVDIATLGAASHRLTGAADQSAAQLIAQIAALDPPAKSGNDAYRRIGGTRVKTLAAWKQYNEGGSGGSRYYVPNHPNHQYRTGSEPPEPPVTTRILDSGDLEPPNHPPPNHLRRTETTPSTEVER